MATDAHPRDTAMHARPQMPSKIFPQLAQLPAAAAARSLPLARAFLAVHRFLERTPRDEGRNLTRRNFHLLAGERIAPFARLARAHDKTAERRERYALALPQRARNLA